MADKVFHVKGNNGLDLMGHLAQCSKCGRKMLVEMTMFGVPHHTGVSVICGTCLTIHDDFRKDNPEVAKQIEEWLTQ